MLWLLLLGFHGLEISDVVFGYCVVVLLLITAVIVVLCLLLGFCDLMFGLRGLHTWCALCGLACSCGVLCVVCLLGVVGWRLCVCWMSVRVVWW